MFSTQLATRTPTRTSAITELGLASWLGTLSENTGRAYHADVRGTDVTGAGGTITHNPGFQDWLIDHDFSDWADVTRGVLNAWLADLASGAATGTPLQLASQSRKLAAVTSFLKFLHGEGVIRSVPAPTVMPKAHRDDAVGSIDAHQARAVWAATAGQPRLRALTAVLLFSGLRRAEAIGLQVGDVQEQQGAKVLRIMRKGSYPGTAVLPAASVEAIDEWLAVRGTHPGPLFCTSSGAAMDARAVHREIVRLGARAGVPGLHPHTLRHTFATTAVDEGIDILVLATALGHKSTATTMRYIRGRDVVTRSPVHVVAAAIIGNHHRRKASV